TGYAGAEVVRLLATHPCAEVAIVTSERNAGQPIAESCPWLSSNLVLSAFDANVIEADFTFLCQEAGFAMRNAESLVSRSRVIDLSGDFRLRDAAVYADWYGREQTAPALLAEAVYGLPELVLHDEISK